MRPVAESTDSSTTISPKTRTSGPSLSVTIIARNEERTIAQVLSAVSPIADEIVFLDSGSSDRTPEIAKSFKVRFYHQDWLGYSEQKNKALELATCEWVLSLDADEVLTPELVEEIRNLMQQGVQEDVAGFSIPRVLYIGDRAVRGGGFYPDAQLRLIRNGKGRFQPRIVHESIRVEGKVRQLGNAMLHYAYCNVEQFAETMDHYAQLSAQHYFETGYSWWQASTLAEILKPAWTFLYRQVFRGGLLQGSLCWKLNVIYAGYVRKKVTYLRELAEVQKRN